MARDARRARMRAEARDTAWLEEQERAHTPAMEDALALAKAMATLPEDQRAAVALCLGEGFSHGEAAEALNLPLGTVKSHITRGREKLLSILETKHG
jgi:RNA polymerase sigma-70 factor (ECF subfamily)